jgi:DNA (cytosine-5)-methyltransferase 1
MKPRLLDLFCGAGGAAMGYSRAGFDVVGVDIEPQKHYPFEFICGDALEYLGWLADHGRAREFDAIHASPPCQAFSSLKSMWNAKEHPDLVGPTRDGLVLAGRPYVIENVVGAPLVAPFMLCGTMFGLGVGAAELRRHRLFEASFPVGLQTPCAHGLRRQVIGVYGGHGRDRRRTVGVYGNAGGHSKRDRGIQEYSTVERREAMGIDWMTGAELSQAIPPAYTEWIGRALMGAL